jgi:hypothetical protein
MWRGLSREKKFISGDSFLRMQKDDAGFVPIGFVFSELEGKNSEHCCNNINSLLIILKSEIHGFLHKKLNNFF